jgi:Domain of unknown function (DUF2760)
LLAAFLVVFLAAFLVDFFAADFFTAFFPADFFAVDFLVVAIWLFLPFSNVKGRVLLRRTNHGHFVLSSHTMHVECKKLVKVPGSGCVHKITFRSILKCKPVDILNSRGRLLSRISSAFRSFFSILFSGVLPEDIALEFGYNKVKPAPAAPEPPKVKITDGALQILHIFQRDSRLIDFLMEDIGAYSDDQIGAAVRTIHADCKASLNRHVTLAPVIDGVEGTFQKVDASRTPDPNRIKLIGNVPASGKVSGGTLRHRGWIASAINLPPLGKQDSSTLAPAELEVE